MAPEDSYRKRPPEPWHIKREIQLGHIITTLTVAIAAGLYITKLEQRIVLLEQASLYQRERDVQQDKSAADSFGLIRQQLDRIENKLGRMLEDHASVLGRGKRPSE